MLDECSKKGAITIAIVNDVDSPLAEIAEFVIPMHVGKEEAVAATKSYIAALTVLAQFIAILTKDNVLLEALKILPDRLAEALQDKIWQSVIDEFIDIDRTFVIGRGFGFPIAQEAALKFKETAGIQAEAFSAAEIYHGPFALIRKDHPFLLFAQSDETLDDILNLAAKIIGLGGKSIVLLPQNVLFASEEKDIASLIIKLPKSTHPLLDPIVAIQAFYPLVARLAVARGFDPDRPQFLQKVTETY
jgi:glucosamine--fructose-6-phosphate aminotransferase (isomerizing)